MASNRPMTAPEEMVELVARQAMRDVYLANNAMPVPDWDTLSDKERSDWLTTGRAFLESPTGSALWARVVAQVRAEALEQAAKVCDERAAHYNGGRYGYDAEDLAELIRALSTPGGGEGDGNGR